MWPRARGASFGVFFLGSRPAAIGTHFSALDEVPRVPAAGKLPGRSRAAGGGEGPAPRRPNRSRASVPGPARPPSPPGSVASPGGEKLHEHEARGARVGDATLEVVVREFQHVGGTGPAGRGQQQRHAREQCEAAGAHGGGGSGLGGACGDGTCNHAPSAGAHASSPGGPAAGRPHPRPARAAVWQPPIGCAALASGGRDQPVTAGWPGRGAGPGGRRPGGRGGAGPGRCGRSWEGVAVRRGADPERVQRVGGRPSSGRRSGGGGVKSGPSGRRGPGRGEARRRKLGAGAALGPDT